MQNITPVKKTKKELILLGIFAVLGITAIFFGWKMVISPWYSWDLDVPIPVSYINGKVAAAPKNMTSEQIQFVLQKELKVDSSVLSKEEVEAALNRVLEKRRTADRSSQLRHQMGHLMVRIGLVLLFSYPFYWLVKIVLSSLFPRRQI